MPTIRGRSTRRAHWPSTRDYSRAYLHHLVRSGETLGAMLLSEINIAYYQRLMQDIRGRDRATARSRVFASERAPNGRAVTSAALDAS